LRSEATFSFGLLRVLRATPEIISNDAFAPGSIPAARSSAPGNQLEPPPTRRFDPLLDKNTLSTPELAFFIQPLTSMNDALTSMEAVLTSMEDVLTSMEDVLTSMKDVLMSMEAVLMSMDDVLMSMDEVLTSMDEVLTSMVKVMTQPLLRRFSPNPASPPMPPVFKPMRLGCSAQAARSAL
jgi:hypothetical protein